MRLLCVLTSFHAIKIIIIKYIRIQMSYANISDTGKTFDDYREAIKALKTRIRI